MSPPREETLLIYAPVPLHKAGDVLTLEDQASNGLRLWAENFDRVLAMYPLDPGAPPPNWVPVEAAVGPDAMARIEIHPVPMAYRPDRFLVALGPMKRRIRALIDRADYLSFSIGGLFGDWGGVSCLEAHKLGRPFAVWTDRVESQVMKRATERGPLRRRIRARLHHRPMVWLERHIIAKSALGLFHGRDTFDAYAPYCRNPHLVHDIHLNAGDHIPEDRLAAKIAGAADGPLRLAYVGRADPMKGPLDWVGVLEALAGMGVDFRATWLGDGEMHQAMIDRIARAGLGDHVTAPGHTADRARVLDTLRDAQIFLFCHKTPESPRCLIEALASGTPVVGYANAFAEDLVSGSGGGRFVPMDDVPALAAATAQLAGDRRRLGDLIARAGRDGAPFTDEGVFRHRSEIIKAHL